MDLFTTEYSSSSAALERTSFIGSASSSIYDRQDIGHHHNFIKFLQYAVILRVNILPLKWEPDLGTVGYDGATGRVNQSLLNASMTFAYKRFKPDITDCRLSESQFRDLQYSAMINEMVILAQPAIGGHDSFPRFVGVCFERSPNAAEFWPVLVLLKADQGDLGAYMSQKSILDPEFLLKICVEIAKGIHVVHQCGIVHGDINPRNILLWQDHQTGGMAVLLADFGFSKFGARDDLIQLSRSEPWDAPEWHPRYFKLDDARKSDIYSFGLVCLWMFFPNEILTELGLPLTTIGNAFMGTDRNTVSQIQSKKADDDTIQQLALHLLVQKTDIHEEIRSRLKTVFSLALARDPCRRPASMEIFVKTLLGSSEEILDIESSIVTMPDWHESLDITDFLFRLDFCDYRVHSFAVQALIRMANDEGCDSCRRRAAFQLSISCSVEFGTCASQDTEEWLLRSNRSMGDLVGAFDQFKSSRQDPAFLEDLAKLGYRYDLPSQYSSEGMLDDALDYYRRGVVAREKVVGPNHSLTWRAKHILILVLMKKGLLEEAWEVVVTLTELDNLSMAHKVAVNATMSRLLMDLGDNVQAEAMTRHILEWFADGLERDHTERLDNQQDLVMLLLQRGECDEALELAQKTVEECSGVLGSGHATTRGAKRCLAASYDAFGQFQMGVEVNEDLTRQDQRALSSEELKPALVQDIARLGIEYYLLGREDAAKKCYKRIQDAVEQSNEIAVHAVNAINNCATRLIIRGDLGKAAIILEALLQESSRVLGVESQEAALIMGNLAHIYDSQMQWDKAETIGRQVIQIRRIILGEKHRDTITAMGNLRHTLLAQKRYEEAANIAQEEYTYFHNASREEKIDVAGTLARALEAAGAFAESIPFFEEELTLQAAEGENSPIDAVSTMMLAAICHMELGQLPSARKLMDKALLRVRDAKELNVDGTTVAVDMVRLANVCVEKNCTTEAEQLLSVVTDHFRQLLENEDLKAHFELVTAGITASAGRLQI